ncbi:MAG: ribulose-phosphate 3-epimerase [Deltaproteobacteria bacterium]|nr:ribulose-phosphate 3-epimerase [Deltaproteobacteria bacterium]
MTASRPTLIAPSILAADFARMGEEIRAVEEAGADWIHVDVMDGHFVPNITIGPGMVEAVRSVTELPLDVHLMIETPDRYVGDFVSAGATTVGVHAEACAHLHRSIQTIKETGARACVVLNPATPPTAIEAVIADVDQVLIMTVNPGFGGQKFIRSALPTVSRIRSWIREQDLDVDLQVDGGITKDTIAEAAEAGANAFVAGTAVFGADDYATAIQDLKKNAHP